MSIDSTTPRTRRALLGAGLGALAATVASAIGRPAPVRAHDPDDVRLGGHNTAATDTTITLQSGGTAFVGRSDSGSGVGGLSYSGVGVYGYSTLSNGVDGTSAASAASGVYGENINHGYGVAGRSNSPPLGAGGVFAAATLGDNTADGVGVWGVSAHGIGVFADAANPDAVAFKANGLTQFARSGRLSIAVGKSSASPLFSVRVDAGTLVLATLQRNQAGLWVQSAVPNPAANSFTITLNKAVTGLVPMKVAWFLVN